MAADIGVIAVREFLETTGEGTYNFERGKAFLQSIAPADFHVLLDVREAPYSLTLADISTLAVEFTRLQIGVGRKIAVVIETDRYDDAQFFAVSARSMGNRVQAFTSFEEAHEWLEQPGS
jgi:hypothetical protein